MIYIQKIISLFVSRAYAGAGDITLSDPLGGQNFQDIVKNIMNGLWEIAVPILGIMVLIGGFQIMTAGGDENKFSSGRKTLMYAVIGFVCILIAQGIVSIVRSVTG